MSRPREAARLSLAPREWLASLADLGTFVPIYLNLVAFNGLPAARSLFLAGLAYIGAGIYFRLPIPIQPLKALCAIAISRGMGMPAVWAAGLIISLACLLLVLSDRIAWLSAFFTQPVVKGIQLGVGLMLIRAGLALCLGGHPPGILASAFRPTTQAGSADFLIAFWALALPQLPLTLGNSIFALSDAAKDYFGGRAARVSPRNLAVSLAVANLASAAFGGLPMCHGSGGLTAHYRWGGRTGQTTVVTGVIFVALAASLGDSACRLLAALPAWLLGAMLVYTGWCHCLLLRGLAEKRLLALAMGLVGLATNNLALALLLGLAAERLGRPPGCSTIYNRSPS